MINFSKSCSSALQGMVALAKLPSGGYHLAGEVAKAADLPEAFLSKLFQRLAHAGLLDSRRGKRGGYALGRDAKDISLLDIITAIEGSPRAERRCLLELRSCGRTEPCPVHTAVLRAEETLQDSFRNITLASFA